MRIAGDEQRVERHYPRIHCQQHRFACFARLFEIRRGPHPKASINTGTGEKAREEQKQREECEDPIQTFAEWLWDNRTEFGEKMYNRFDEYTGIDESTEDLNYR